VEEGLGLGGYPVGLAITENGIKPYLKTRIKMFLFV
jgi:hypothetical protein